ncbi:Predicted arabinose efflux permease, MFS family [Epibacterium ulvae]|uniref:Predicted arabinose efflux permease, MFS family n=1 Tax=Epibacterium ulvae TaxID=1156985 RepID=A0A1G5Q5J6_9RHOB|nr:MFS transporter [Epibacterium ulvae]SCZ57154.1 Predicted arabinose efflux permease, MFS family [Epibacterium ulvae]
MDMQSGTRWGTIGIVWASGLGAAAQYGKLSVTFDRLPELYPDVGTAASFAVSLVGVMGILLGVVAGMSVAAFGFRRTLVGSMWLGAAMSALQVFHLPFGAFLATRIVEGISHLGVVVAAPTLIALMSDARGRGLAMTLWGSFFGVAFALLSWLGVPFAEAYGVLALYAAHAVFMAGLALILGWVLADTDVPARTPMPAVHTWIALHLSIYRNPWKMSAASGWAFYALCFVALMTVLPPYIAEDVRQAVMTAFPLVSIASSLTLGVFLLRYISAVLVVQIGFGASAVMALWLVLMPGDPLACMALAATLGLVQGASFAVTPQLLKTPADQAEANGALAQAGNLGNTIGTPLMVLIGAGAGYGGIMLLCAAVLIAGVLVHSALHMLRKQQRTHGDLA